MSMATVSCQATVSSTHHAVLAVLCGDVPRKDDLHVSGDAMRVSRTQRSCWSEGLLTPDRVSTVHGVSSQSEQAHCFAKCLHCLDRTNPC
jgi:hypothetical protein